MPRIPPTPRPSTAALPGGAAEPDALAATAGLPEHLIAQMLEQRVLKNEILTDPDGVWKVATRMINKGHEALFKDFLNCLPPKLLHESLAEMGANTPAGLIILARSLDRCPFVKHLVIVMPDTALEGPATQAVMELANALEHDASLPALTLINLPHGDALASFAGALARNAALRTLVVEVNSATNAEDLNAFFAGLLGNEGLRALDLDFTDNAHAGTPLPAFEAFLRSNHSLGMLTLRNAEVPALAALRVLQNNECQLTDLKLEAMHCDSVDGRTWQEGRPRHDHFSLQVRDMLQSNETLRTLRLAGNLTSSLFLVMVGEALARPGTLEGLVLREDESDVFSDYAVEAFARAVRPNVNLTTLAVMEALEPREEVERLQARNRWSFASAAFGPFAKRLYPGLEGQVASHVEKYLSRDDCRKLMMIDRQTRHELIVQRRVEHKTNAHRLISTLKVNNSTVEQDDDGSTEEHNDKVWHMVEQFFRELHLAGFQFGRSDMYDIAQKIKLDERPRFTAAVVNSGLMSEEEFLKGWHDEDKARAQAAVQPAHEPTGKRARLSGAR